MALIKSVSSPAVLQTLLWTRKQGFKAVPLLPQSKAAISNKYAEQDYDPPPDSLWQSHNYGVGVVVGPSAHGPVDIDLDCPEAVYFAPRFLPPTPAVFGRASKRASHYLYRVSVPSLTKFALLDPVEKSTIIELRADSGHQTVLPGCVHQDTGELIEWENVPFPDVPTVDDVSLAKAVRKIAITTIIARHLWHEGMRNQVVLALSGLFFFVDWPLEDVQTIIEAVMDFTGDDDQTRKRTVALTYKKGEKGGRIGGAPTLRKLIGNDAVVDKLLDLAGSPSINILQDYNSRFAVVNVEGKFRIADLDVPASESPVFMQKDDFLNIMGTDLTTIDDKPVLKAKLWLSNSRRRSYRTVDFLPGVEDSDRALNLWTGWAVEPDATASYSAWQELLHDVICGKDDTLHEWMIQWLANIIREPLDKSLTSPVMISKQGAGKSLLFRYFGKILGSAYTHVTNEEHIYGKFNKHMATTLLLHSDEALHGGEKKHRAIIKSLITDEHRIFEQKGIDAKQVKNYLRLALTTNETQAAPVEAGDRRFTVIDMEDRILSDKLKGHVLKELKEGGPGGLLEYFLRLDYKPEVPRTNIKNEALQTMKGINQSPMESWWQDVLMNGALLPDHLAWAQKPPKDEWTRIVSSPALHMSLKLRMKSLSQKPVPNETHFAMQLNKLVGKKLIRAQHWYTNPQSDDAPMDVKQMSDRQNTVINMPTLPECRKAFMIHMGAAFDWPADAEEKPPHEKF